jgi:hypothetical protein
MLLVSQAVDDAVGGIDFTLLREQTVFLDASALSQDLADKEYLISEIRQQLLSQGVELRQERQQATYVIELRVGALGTDRHTTMLGSPEMTLPSAAPGVPGTTIPEISILKKSKQRGVAKIGVFAYNRRTGRALWQSGTIEVVTSSCGKKWW